MAYLSLGTKLAAYFELDGLQSLSSKLAELCGIQACKLP